MPTGLTNAFYVNDLVASQTLDTNKQNWTLDPKHRLRAFTTSAWSTAPGSTRPPSSITTATNPTVHSGSSMTPRSG